MGFPELEFTDPMAREIYSGITLWYQTVGKYRGTFPNKDNYQWGQAQESLRECLEHIELAAGHWKRGGPRA